MAKHTSNDRDSQHPGAHEQGGSSVGFYILIALVLGAITYLEFALVERQDVWFTFLDGRAILIWLIVLSVVKFALVVMFFMHLQQDDRTFTGFFSSGMVIAVGTLFALSALFTVRSVAAAQTPQQEEATAAQAEGEGEAEVSLAHRFEYPPPKTQATGIIDLNPLDRQINNLELRSRTASGTVSGTGAAEEGQQAAAGTAGRTPDGLPLADAPAAVTLPDPFSAQAMAAAPQNTGAGNAAPAGGAGAGGAGGGGGALLADADTSAGEQIFSGNCAACHQATGQGLPGAFPPLAGHAPALAKAEGGREYLASVLLYGLQGEINVSGQTYNGQMPAWAQFSDDELASTLNYVLSSWGNADALPADYPAFTAEEIAAQRSTGLSTAQVYELRQALELP